MKSVNLQISGIDRPRLSGGERQRLGIAQAQVNYPDLLILDEPAASLDPMGRHDVLEVMERLRKYTTIFYSTHILEDVQRVSDTVCILNHGELVAQAPIQELLAGNGKVIFQIQTRGEIQEIWSVIAGQPWVTTVQVAQSNGRAEWEVSVSDVNAAEDQLLGLVMSVPAVKVTSFGQSKFDLEEVFMNLVGGNDHGKQ
jgi:ABC-2 type transport system ATP-binding protein